MAARQLTDWRYRFERLTNIQAATAVGSRSLVEAQVTLARAFVLAKGRCHGGGEKVARSSHFDRAGPPGQFRDIAYGKTVTGPAAAGYQCLLRYAGAGFTRVV